jgi:DNA helicase HerA-like ATPase
MGLTGCGKSVLAKNILNETKNVVIVDPKREFHFNGALVTDKINNKLFQYPTIFRPSVHDIDNIKVYNSLFEHLYNKGNVTIYVDELACFTTALRYPHFLKVCYMLGRSKGISVIGTTQRPANIPVYTISESSKFYAFKLHVPTDVKKVDSFMPGYAKLNFSEKYAFGFYDINANKEPTLLKIGVKTNAN